MHIVFLVTLSILALCCSHLNAGEPVNHIPKIEGIKLDGYKSDWKDKGFNVGILAQPSGQVRLPDDFDASVLLGWDIEGLLLFITVKDGEIIERTSMHGSDSVTVTLSPSLNTERVKILTISPGNSERFEEIRKSGSLADADVARQKVSGGYTMELRIPWKSIGTVAESETRLHAQIAFTDHDTGHRREYFYWQPHSMPGELLSPAHLLELSNKTTNPVHAVAATTYKRFRQTEVDVHALSSYSGQSFKLRSGAQTLGMSKFIVRSGRAYGHLSFPIAPRGQPFGAIDIVTEDNVVIGSFHLPDADAARAEALFDAEFHYHPYVFSGSEFPTGEFEQPLLVEEAFGPYALKYAYYDTEFNKVESADKPGRYGAVVTVASEDSNKVFRRYRTLFRQTENLDWRKAWNKNSWNFSLPDEYGIEPEKFNANQVEIAQAIKENFLESAYRNPSTAMILAGLYEMEDERFDTPDPYRLSKMDRQWWVTLKRKLNGDGLRYQKPFSGPTKSTHHATVLRGGTEIQAGMKDGTEEQVDTLLKEWSEDSDEAFSVCLARNGVIFFHKSYGMRSGRPMTNEDTSYIDSLTRVLGGISMLMFVEKGIFDLDTPLAEYFPEFNTPKKNKLTFRHLFTHTSGLRGREAAFMHDLEERVSTIAPVLRVGERWISSGRGNDLAGKLIERVTGEALPYFYSKHILEPLGAKKSQLLGMSLHAFVRSIDLARIGQVIINKGSYGPYRFFGEREYESLVPRTLEEQFGIANQREYGIGTMSFGRPLPEGTIGYENHSHTTFRVVPQDQLIIVMTRNTGGTNFRQYHNRFLQLVADNIAD